jgi:DNA-binding GntR family transcriptional regulator
VEAIARGDGTAARALTEEHVRGTADFLIGLRLGKVR